MIEDITPASTTTDSQIHTFTHDWSAQQSVGVSIIRAVAAVSDVDPLSLQPRLYDVVDPDALKALLTAETASSSVEITFGFGSYEVTVRKDGEIIVREETTAAH
jgi:hypothetical protein